MFGPVVGAHADGRLQVFTIGTDYQPWTRSQLAGGGWSNWAGMGGDFSGPMAVVTNTNGRMQLFGRSVSRALYHKTQVAPNGGFPTAWTSGGGALTVNLNARRSIDGRVEVLSRGTNNQAYIISQTSPGGPMGAWTGLLGLSIASGVASVSTDEGFEVFARGADGSVYRRVRSTTGEWSPWEFITDQVNATF